MAYHKPEITECWKALARSRSTNHSHVEQPLPLKHKRNFGRYCICDSSTYPIFQLAVVVAVYPALSGQISVRCGDCLRCAAPPTSSTYAGTWAGPTKVSHISTTKIAPFSSQITCFQADHFKQGFEFRIGLFLKLFIHIKGINPYNFEYRKKLALRDVKSSVNSQQIDRPSSYTEAATTSRKCNSDLTLCYCFVSLQPITS